MDIEGCVGPQNSLLWPFWALFSFLWHTMTLPYTKNYSNLLPGLCLNYSLIDTDPPDWSHQIHLWSKGPFLAVLEPMGPGPMAPSMAHLTHKTVPRHHHGCVWRFGLIGPFVCPLMPLDGPHWPTKLLRSITPDVPWLVPNCFTRL